MIKKPNKGVEETPPKKEEKKTSHKNTESEGGFRSKVTLGEKEKQNSEEKNISKKDETDGLVNITPPPAQAKRFKKQSVSPHAIKIANLNFEVQEQTSTPGFVQVQEQLLAFQKEEESKEKTADSLFTARVRALPPKPALKRAKKKEG